MTRVLQREFFRHRQLAYIRAFRHYFAKYRSPMSDTIFTRAEAAMTRAREIIAALYHIEISCHATSIILGFSVRKLLVSKYGPRTRALSTNGSSPWTAGL